MRVTRRRPFVECIAGRQVPEVHVECCGAAEFPLLLRIEREILRLAGNLGITGDYADIDDIRAAIDVDSVLAGREYRDCYARGIDLNRLVGRQVSHPSIQSAR